MGPLFILSKHHTSGYHELFGPYSTEGALTIHTKRTYELASHGYVQIILSRREALMMFGKDRAFLIA